MTTLTRLMWMLYIVMEQTAKMISKDQPSMKDIATTFTWMVYIVKEYRAKMSSKDQSSMEDIATTNTGMGVKKEHEQEMSRGDALSRRRNQIQKL